MACLLFLARCGDGALTVWINDDEIERLGVHASASRRHLLIEGMDSGLPWVSDDELYASVGVPLTDLSSARRLSAGRDVAIEVRVELGVARVRGRATSGWVELQDAGRRVLLDLRLDVPPSSPPWPLWKRVRLRGSATVRREP